MSATRSRQVIIGDPMSNERMLVTVVKKRQYCFAMHDEMLQQSGKKLPFVPYKEGTRPRELIQLDVLKESIADNPKPLNVSKEAGAHEVLFEHRSVVRELYEQVEKGIVKLPLTRGNPAIVIVPARHTTYTPDEFPGDSDGDGYAMVDPIKGEYNGKIALRVWFDDKNNLVAEV